jgi:MOSC domain-containing protein YiiM
LDDAQISKLSKEQQAKVNQSAEIHQGPERLDDKEHGGQQKPPAKHQDNSEREDATTSTETLDEQPVQDPLLGNNIDISG